MEGVLLEPVPPVGVLIPEELPVVPLNALPLIDWAPPVPVLLPLIMRSASGS